MDSETAVRMVLREFADPRCRRCGGAGTRGDDVVNGLCRCVEGRVPPVEEPAGEGADDLPHPWGTIARRAQRIHAAALLQLLPDSWS